MDKQMLSLRSVKKDEYVTTDPEGNLEDCPVDDPRMGLQPTKIEWLDGSVTNITGTSD